jgi:hypothetical protein
MRGLMKNRTRRNGGPHNDYQCRSGTCATKHGPACEGGTLALADLRSLRAAVATNDVQRIIDMLSAHPSQVTVNHHRSAVQVADCTGDVVAHLPLEASVLKRLAHLGAAGHPKAPSEHCKDATSDVSCVPPAASIRVAAITSAPLRWL